MKCINLKYEYIYENIAFFPVLVYCVNIDIKMGGERENVG